MAKWCLLLLATFIAGCVTPRSAQIPPQQPAEVEERAVVDGEVLPLPQERVISAEPLPGQRSESAVVRKLLASASTQARDGNNDGAANSLERALRIEPRNALLWSRLATVRFSQENWQQAIQMAAKSNTLAGPDAGLRRQNWNLMASSYEAMGQSEKAEKFRAKLRDR